jgi:tryptophan-rich sensory protein
MDSQTWYRQLIKPSWAPPAWLFGPVWTVLYVIIAVSFGYIAYLFTKGKIPLIVLLPFILNIIANLAFTPLQFGLRSNILAAIDILLVLGTLVWLMVAIWPYAGWVALVNIPYLLWVCFATVLQLVITIKNL